MEVALRISVRLQLAQDGEEGSLRVIWVTAETFLPAGEQSCCRAVAEHFDEVVWWKNILIKY